MLRILAEPLLDVKQSDADSSSDHLPVA